MKVLVTGAAGFIGSHTCDLLLQLGHEVIGVDDLSTGRMTNLEAASARGRFAFHELDIVDADFAACVRTTRPEAVVHLAAQMDVRKSVADPLADARVNVLGTVQLLTAASQSGVRQVVFASSGGTVYGEPAELPVDEAAPLRPVSPYGAAKVAGEAYVKAFAALYGMTSCILALGNVYGPRQDPHGEAGVVSIFAQRLLAGHPTTIYGDGGSIRDYVYVGDVVEAIGTAVDSTAEDLRLNIGTGVGTSVRELHTLLAGIATAPDEPGSAAPRQGELQRIVLDVTAAATALPWTPRTPLEEGLVKTVDWLRAGRAA